MKRGTKIFLIVLGIVFGIGVIGFIAADIAVTYVVKKQVDKALAQMPTEYGEVSYDGLQVRLFSGTAGISDIRYTYKSKIENRHGSADRKKSKIDPGVEIKIGHIEVGRLFYAPLLFKQVVVSDIRIFDPSIELWMDEKHPEYCFPKLPEDTVHKPFPLKRAELINLRIYDACFALHSLRTKLDVVADTLSLTVHDLAFDSIFHYNDSSYYFSLAHAAVLIPDGKVRIETRDIEQEDQGALSIGSTQIAHTMAKNKLADLVREPATWISMHIEKVQTAPFNPVRKALAQDYTLDRAEVVVGKMDIFRDTRYKPKKPFPMPQQILMALPVTFDLKHVDALIRDIHIELASTERNIGQMDLKDIQAEVEHVTNRRAYTLAVKGSCPLDKGQGQASMSMTMNKDCPFAVQMHVTDVDVAFLSPFIRPLVGMAAECHIDTLDSHYKGNNVRAAGTFRMLYHGLQVKVYKDDDVPYKIVTRNANTFTTLGNSLIPKSNPTIVDYNPRAYQVEWKRNEMQPFPLYLFGPCIDGVKKTFLPGLYVHMQVRGGI